MAKTLEWLNAKTQTIWWQLEHETWSNWSNPSPFRNLHSIIAKPTAEWFASNYRRISLTMMFERTEMMIPLKLWIVYLGCTNLHFGTESKMSYVKKKALATCATRRGQPKKKEKQYEGEEETTRNRKKTAESIHQRRIANKQVRAWSAWWFVGPTMETSAAPGIFQALESSDPWSSEFES